MHTPDWVTARLILAGGTNRFNGPNYRAVWSNSRLETIGDEHEDYDAAGNKIRSVVEYRQIPKYWMSPNRWIVEKWMPPEYYGSPESWKKQTGALIGGKFMLQLGDFPSQGDYELAYTLEEMDGTWMPLNSTVVEGVVLRIQASIERFTAAQRKASLLRREEQKEKDTFNLNDALISDNMLTFHGANGQVVLTDWDKLPSDNEPTAPVISTHKSEEAAQKPTD